MKKYEVSEELLNAVLNYMGTKPYSEVFQLVKAIQEQAKPIEDKKVNIFEEHICNTSEQ